MTNKEKTKKQKKKQFWTDFKGFISKGNVVDLAVALALISSMNDVPIPENILAMGEIGLAGECRSITDVQKRINESYRLGFDTIAVPEKSLNEKIKIPKGVSLIPIESVYDALSLFKTK
jgi:DNA repair protein RadA/Sms